MGILSGEEKGVGGGGGGGEDGILDFFLLSVHVVQDATIKQEYCFSCLSFHFLLLLVINVIYFLFVFKS